MICSSVRGLLAGDAELELRGCETLRRRFAKPGDGPRIVAANARTLGSHQSQVVLRCGVAQRGGFLEPRDRLRIVLRDTVARCVNCAQFLLRRSVALVRRLAVVRVSEASPIAGGAIALYRPRTARCGSKRGLRATRLG